MTDAAEFGLEAEQEKSKLENISAANQEWQIHPSNTAKHTEYTPQSASIVSVTPPFKRCVIHARGSETSWHKVKPVGGRY